MTSGLGSILDNWKTRSFGAIGFAFAKASMFLAPILLVQMVGLQQYGVFEFAIAAASVLSLVIGCGTVGAIPYFLIKRNRPVYVRPVQIHIFLTGILFLAGGALAVAKMTSELISKIEAKLQENRMYL